MREHEFDIPPSTPMVGDYFDHELEAAVVVDKYMMGLEPLENWSEEDLKRFQAAIVHELSEREDAVGNR